MFTCTYFREYTHLKLQVRSTFWRLQLKSVQTSAVVCTDYTCSLHRLRRGFDFRKRRDYFPLVDSRLSAHAKARGGLIKRTIRSLLNLLFRCGLSSLRRDSTALYKYETVGRSHKGQVLLVLWWGFAECGNRKALRLKAQGVYLCK